MRFINNFTSRSAALFVAALVISVLGLTTTARAQFVWTPNNNNTQVNWTTGNNWVGTAPVNNSSGTFTFADPNQKLNNNNNLTGITMTALIFSNTAGATVIGGNAVTLSGGITNNSTSLQTINLAMSTTAVRTISTTSGNITIGGVISGTGGGIIKDGANILTLSAANTYTGDTTVSSGTLAYGIANALGSGNVIVNGATAVFAISTFSDTVGAVTLTDGSITGSTGVLTGTSYSVVNGSISAILAGAGALTKS
ncbi:MAG: autotransporter-associated beta strand repeat-containing protein, partial [Chthoniobacterales bacterium]